jgi:uncharacterized YigZ family protein
LYRGGQAKLRQTRATGDRCAKLLPGFFNPLFFEALKNQRSTNDRKVCVNCTLIPDGKLMDFYYSIAKPGTAEFKDRGSRFIAYAFPIESRADFKERMQEIKKLHAKATHHCFAYRLGLDKTDFRVSDDGEPSGSAGRPILGQIDSKELTNTLVVVVRYFGGTLLGVPGLINAYKTATSFVLQVTPVVQKQIEVIYDLQFDYTVLNEVMTTIKRFNCTVLRQDMQLFSVMKIGVDKRSVEDVLRSFKEIQNLTLELAAG